MKIATQVGLIILLFTSANLCAFAEVESAHIAVENVLDELHDAASKADGERYFSLFAPDAVFLGTDATERWTIDEFRAYAMQYFEAGTGWTYHVREDKRFISMNEDETVAWFDELLDNAKYGECRGTGVLRKILGEWKIAQYNLTFPIPNEIASDVVGIIQGKHDAPTTVVFIRHAEKKEHANRMDPPISESGRHRAIDLKRILKSVKINAVYVSQFKRTRQTIEPLANQLKIDPTTINAQDMDGLVHRLQHDHHGQTVLVCGHSNTIPPLLHKLGIKKTVSIDESDYDDIFVVQLHPCFDSELIHLHYGKE